MSFGICCQVLSPGPALIKDLDAEEAPANFTSFFR
jgi:hypothetical protein